MCCSRTTNSAPASSWQRVEGETIPRKILRDEKFAKVRPRLARQCGGILAAIHGIAQPELPELRRMTAATEIAELEQDIAASTGRGRCSNWRCAGCATTIPVHRKK